MPEQDAIRRARQDVGDPSRPLRGRRMSLERKLPLLMTALLAISLATALAITSAALRESATDTARERMTLAGRQLAEVAATGVARAKGRFAVVARDPVIREALIEARGSGGRTPAAPSRPAAIEEALSYLNSALTTDSTRPIELWTDDGRRIAHIGADVRLAPRERVDGEPSPLPVPHEGLDEVAKLDSATYGRIYVDSGNVFGWIVVAVNDDGGSPLGYVTQQFVIRGGAQAAQTIRALTGGDVSVYYRNDDGSLWTTIAGVPSSAPLARDSAYGGIVVERPRVGRSLAFDAAIAGTPYWLVLEQPIASVLAAPTSTMTRLGLIALLIVLGSAAASWLISRRITEPLTSLTTAAEAIAQGDYASRVDARGSDEVARLATSFNRMTGEIDASRRELREQVATARTIAEELEHANERMRTTNQQLHDANRQLSETMREASAARAEAEQARLHAEAANRAKSEFLTVMSHELRTPLNAIGGYTELMDMELRGPVTEAQRRDLDRIRTSQQHLLSLINAVLDLSRIETGRVHYQLATLPLDEFLAGLDALVEPQATAKALRLDYDPCPPVLTVVADQEKLRQVLLNLLSNAIRYTPAGGRVTLTAEACDEHVVAIRVRDTGVGIDADKLEHIFEPFVQLDRTLARSGEGVGLGLAISRDLTRGMGGGLSVESIVGAGSCFTVTLPRGVPDAALSAVVSGEGEAAQA